MEFNEAKFQQIVEGRGTIVCSASYDAGVESAFYRGVAYVAKYDGYFYSYDDNDLFAGPFNSLAEALSESHLNFEDTEITINVSGMSPADYARRMKVNAPAGHGVLINNEVWALDAGGDLVLQNRPRKTRT
jgi:hypothetical protein